MAQAELAKREVKIEVLSLEAYAHYWPEVSDALDSIKFMWEPWFTKEFLRACQLHGVTIWGFGDGTKLEIIMYTQIYNYVSTTVFQLMLVFGQGLDRMLPTIEAFFTKVAHDQGCAQFEVIGRPGWERKFKGVKRVATVLRKDIPKFGVH